jgi:hypothetical protein
MADEIRIENNYHACPNCGYRDPNVTEFIPPAPAAPVSQVAEAGQKAAPVAVAAVEATVEAPETVPVVHAGDGTQAPAEAA